MEIVDGEIDSAYGSTPCTLKSLLPCKSYSQDTIMPYSQDTMPHSQESTMSYSQESTKTYSQESMPYSQESTKTYSQEYSQESNPVGSNSDNQDWRFEIYPQDAAENYEMFKPHVKEQLILSCSFDSQTSNSPLNCSPSTMYSCSPKDVFSPTELLFGNITLLEQDETFFAMSPPNSLQELEYPVIAPVRHISSPKKDRDRAFPCTMCSSTFSRNHDLKRHTRFDLLLMFRIHLGIRPFKCETCPKSFTRLDALYRHSTNVGCKGMVKRNNNCSL